MESQPGMGEHPSSLLLSSVILPKFLTSLSLSFLLYQISAVLLCYHKGLNTIAHVPKNSCIGSCPINSRNSTYGLSGCLGDLGQFLC